VNDFDATSRSARNSVVEHPFFRVPMLTRVSCEHCLFSCLWTDDPKGFLSDACLKPSACEARCRMQVMGTRPGSVRRNIPSVHEGVLLRPAAATVR
jgi:hypothetical protein